jgi:glyoxylase-like metal-dependent hydrolase (beta-lactamase superfamily II)
MAIKVESLPLGPVGANTYIVTDEASGLSAVIDCGAFTPQLREKLRGKTVKYIMLTHGHYDHILGVYDLKQATGAEVLIHKDDANCLYDSMASLAFYSYGQAQQPLKADRVLTEGDRIELGQTVFRVMNTKGHTEGSVLYIDEADRVIFSGDTLFAGSYGRTDLPGGDDGKMLNSLRRIKSLEGDYKSFTGHDQSTTLEEERKFNVYLRSS